MSTAWIQTWIVGIEGEHTDLKTPPYELLFLLISDTISTLTFNDGKRLKYVGEVQDGQPEGAGIMIFKNGTLIYSNWINGFFSGYHFKAYDETSSLVSFSGDHDFGTMIFKAGAQYKGSFKVNQLDHGTLTFWDNETYVGTFVNNLKHGKGFTTFSPADPLGRKTFEGQYEHGNEKSGTLTFTNGGSFVGDFESQERMNGTFYSPEGSRYVGALQNYRMHGQGLIFIAEENKSGIKFLEGYFENGLPRQKLNKTFLCNNS